MNLKPWWAVACLLMGLTLLSSCGRYRDEPLCDEHFAEGDFSGFQLRDGGLATDPETGLTWYRCNAGERFRDDQCVGLAVLLTRDDAVAYVDDFNRSSQRRWRLPTRDEFSSLMAEDCVNPAINRRVFPSVVSDSYWNADESRHNDYMGCTTNTYSGYSFCREMLSNQRPFLLVTGGDSR